MRERISRITVLLSAVAIIMGLILVGSAFAGGGVTKYPWNLPANVRIVQKDTVDNVRIFSTIQAALASITDASASKPYVIKVMPGIYNETIPLLLKQYVALIGSGQESTILNSLGNISLETADNTAVENIQIRGYIAVRLSGTNPILRNVKIIASPVGIDDQSPSAEVSDSTIIVESGEYTYWIAGGSPTVTDCKIINKTPDPCSYCGKGVFQFGMGEFGTKSYPKIINTEIKATGVGISVLAIPGESTIDLINSSVVGDQKGIDNQDGDSNFNAVNTKIVGGHNGLSGRDKVLNCYDENYNPIPNL